MSEQSPYQKNQKNQKKSNDPGSGKYLRYTGIAFEMIAVILVAVWGGLKLDEKYNGGKPLFIIILSILGIFVALYTALKDFIRFKK